MELNHDQKSFFMLLLRKLNFSSESFGEDYLKKLTANITEKQIIWHSNNQQKSLYNNSNLILEIYDEIHLKLNKNKIRSKEKMLDTKSFRASDISSFIFCPVSFSILRSFEIEKLKNKIAIYQGEEFHEKFLFKMKKGISRAQAEQISHLSPEKRDKMLKIACCELLYSGHDEEDRKTLFENNIEGFRFFGIPDYILKDSNGNNFVIEEKFSKNKYTTFYDNHLGQLYSYIKFIREHNIQYGILVNWTFDYKNKSLRVTDFKTKVVRLPEYEMLFNETFSQMKKILDTGSVDFDLSSLNANKCASCSVRMYCGHKTKKFNTLSYPYSLDYLKLSDEKLYTKALDIDFKKVSEIFDWN